MRNFKHFVFNQTNFLDLNLFQIGEEKCVPLHFFGPVIRNHYMFHFILSGKGTYFADFGTKYPSYEGVLKAGNGFLIIPGSPHSYLADETEPWHYIWIEFDGVNAANLLYSCGLSPAEPVYTTQKNGTDIFNNLKEHLLYIINNPESSTQALLGHLYLFFDQLYLHSSINNCLKQSIDMSKFYIEKAIRYIENHYQSIATVEEVAAFCNLSRSYLGKIFKKNMHITIQDYLINFRLKKSLHLLQETCNPICDIAYAIGYNSDINFSRAFKQKFGMSPFEWRKYNNNN